MRKVVFEGDSLDVIRALPGDARHRAGYEIDRVQRDKVPENWKPFPTIGQGVRELRIQTGRQFRVVYIAKFDMKVHILHVFEKKTQKTRQSDIEIARNRFKEVVKRYR
ncbi:type II toxin-antitoxin system RelE/ParE family toxin [Thiohalophilus sp.]|uniref:type II toxin-antitoxin system RelE/ParE family toxin n=1 Tax=Thiohalophilus sp. TaxID=3028392 RepID=UPI002ACEDA37|nr:type II toxin-antitoxin system RelE/ParE family toxin [Thiohalophilus sp.]MDZ7663637.1 type II toxin-antitoxin system RelE/ParE family toxin [Thiohalophilus sp.]